MTALSYPEETDFDIIREDWTKFQIKTDKALFRVRITVSKILITGMGDVGLPNLTIAAQNYISVLVPKELLKRVGEAPELNQPIGPDHIRDGEDMDFDLTGELKWQEYKTASGWLVMVRPEVGRIVRLKYYTRIGQTGLMEPIYWANIQTVFRVKKL
jgi:hypothetical protein